MFTNVVGQENPKTILRNMVNADRIPHALLLLGKEGFGGLALAQAYIQYMLCENRSATDACGACKACSKTQKMIHPDVHYSYPVFGPHIATDFVAAWRKDVLNSPYFGAQQWLSGISKGENKQGNINKDECLSIIKKLSLKSFEAPFKVLLMWLPEYLGKEGNRLLKMIEEPPENTIFILVAENQEAILPTILSRCQLVKLSPLSDDDIRNALVARISLPEKNAESIAALAEGNFSEAIYLSQYTENDNNALFIEWMRKCYSGNGADIIMLADKIASGSREAQKFFLRYGLHFLRELAMLNAGMKPEKIKLQSSALESAQKMSKIIGLPKIAPIAELFDNAITAIERNGSGRMVFADASIKLHKILRSTNQ
jgi:DNA polymerase-3 subunit delta'